jgi:hypothetical protein
MIHGGKPNPSYGFCNICFILRQDISIESWPAGSLLRSDSQPFAPAAKLTWQCGGQGSIGILMLPGL